jgi:hypothetical protein
VLCVCVCVCVCVLLCEYEWRARWLGHRPIDPGRGRSNAATTHLVVQFRPAPTFTATVSVNCSHSSKIKNAADRSDFSM